MVNFKEFNDILEATDPYVFMLRGDLEYSKLRSGVEYNFKNLEDRNLTIDIKPKLITIKYKACNPYDLYWGLYKRFDILTPRFSPPDELINHVNDPKKIEQAKEVYNTATKKFSSCHYSIPYTLNRTVGKYCEIFKDVEGDCREKFGRYVRFEPAWHQELYDEVVFPGEEPWKFWLNKLEIPFAIGNYFSHVYGTDSIDAK